MNATGWMWRSEHNLWESVLSSHHWSLRNQTQFDKLDSKGLYQRAVFLAHAQVLMWDLEIGFRSSSLQSEHFTA